ncbi:MAG TPA: low specificity L-threonine aldolase, partial [Aliiroseovarius sp.]|nr:low specificity L-threonine aldolase [Aliiroseovarius sp.]
ANALALATLAQPYQTIYTTPDAHVMRDECNAPEFFTGGAKLLPVGSEAGKMRPEALARALDPARFHSEHDGMPGAVSLTNLTERGTLYTPDEIAALARIAHGAGVPVHLDGARLANALAASGASLAEMTWKAGVDAVSLGATKNGALAAEAVVLFDPGHAGALAFRRMRGGHLLSKHRYLSAQMLAWLDGGLWLDLARDANARAATLARGLRAIDGVEITAEPQGNIIFARWRRALHQRLFAAGAEYHMIDGDPETGDPEALLGARLVTSWCTREEEVRDFLACLSA